jgi:outer membrane protein assembly factor BamB
MTQRSLRRSILVPVCLLAATLLGAGLSAAEPTRLWPQFRGPMTDGHAEAKGLPTTFSDSQNVVWKTPVHGQGWSSPVIWGNQVWMTTATPNGKEMFAVCLDKTTGEVVHDIKLFDVAEPREKHAMNSYASPTPVIEEGRVFVHFGSYGTACLDTATGKTLWKRDDLPCNHWRGPGSSPISFKDWIIIHYDGFDFQYVVALDKATGETVWRHDRTIDFATDNGDFKKAYATPLVIEVAGRTQLISPASKATVAYDPLTGEPIWWVTYDQFSATARPIYDGEFVYINTGFSRAELLAVRPTGEGDVTSSHVEWKATKSVPSKGSQLLVDGLIYMMHDAGVATCLDAKTGDVVWQERVKGQFSASPIYADGKIYFCSHEGKVIVLAPGREYQQLAENEFPDGFMSSPAVVDNALFLRSKTSVYRIEKLE